MMRTLTLEDERFYVHALQVNWEGNNRITGHSRPIWYGEAFAPPRGPEIDRHCALSNPDHAGTAQLCRYVDKSGRRWHQYLCAAHRGPCWMPLGLSEQAVYSRRQRDRIVAKRARLRQINERV